MNLSFRKVKFKTRTQNKTSRFAILSLTQFNVLWLKNNKTNRDTYPEDWEEELKWYEKNIDRLKFFFDFRIALSHTSPAFSITSGPLNAIPLHRRRQPFASPARCSNDQSQPHVTSWLFCLFLYQVHPVTEKMLMGSFQGQTTRCKQPDPAAKAEPAKGAEAPAKGGKAGAR